MTTSIAILACLTILVFTMVGIDIWATSLVPGVKKYFWKSLVSGVLGAIFLSALFTSHGGLLVLNIVLSVMWSCIFAFNFIQLKHYNRIESDNG